MSATVSTGPVLQGVLLESKPDTVVIGLPGTEYRLHLVTASPISAPLNKPIRGTVYARVRRVDRLPSGGKFIEPLFGRPRRIHGRISAIDADHNTITIQGPVPMICELTVDPRAGAFAEGDLVGCDIERGARFEIASH
jgi:hypothetical protein